MLEGEIIGAKWNSLVPHDDLQAHGDAFAADFQNGFLAGIEGPPHDVPHCFVNARLDFKAVMLVKPEDSRTSHAYTDAVSTYSGSFGIVSFEN